MLVDRDTQLYSPEVVGGLAVACIICTSVMCLIVHFTIRRLRQNTGQLNVNIYVVALRQTNDQVGANRFVDSMTLYIIGYIML